MTSKRKNQKFSRRHVRREYNREVTESASKSDSMRAPRRNYGGGKAKK